MTTLKTAIIYMFKNVKENEHKKNGRYKKVANGVSRNEQLNIWSEKYTGW